MTLPRLARAGLACVLLLLFAATPASAETRKQAADRALAALGAKKGSDPVIVFGLTKPVAPGTRVTQAGSKKTVARVGSERAWFFYQDSGPFRLYPHTGRVALVGVRTGKTKV